MIDIGAPDERQHANYVIHLLEGKGPPRLDLKSASPEEDYEFLQPPLYYAVASCWAAATGANPEDPKDGFRLRLLGCLFGIGTVFGVYFGLFWGFRNEAIAIGGTAFVGLLPMFCAVNAWINNDSLLFALCAWTLALTLRAMRAGWTWRSSVGVGALLGLSLLTKSSALALVPAVAAGLIFCGEHRPKAWAAFAGLVAVAVIVGPWWSRNMQLYGDPLALAIFHDKFGGNPYFEAMKTDPAEFKRWIYDFTRISGMSFVGMFGYMHILLPIKLYALFWSVFGILCTGWFGAKSLPEWSETRALRSVLWILLAFALAFYVRFNMQQHQPQMRYAFTALTPIAMIAGVGLAGCFKRRIGLALRCCACRLWERTRTRYRCCQPNSKSGPDSQRCYPALLLLGRGRILGLLDLMEVVADQESDPSVRKLPDVRYVHRQSASKLRLAGRRCERSHRAVRSARVGNHGHERSRPGGSVHPMRFFEDRPVSDDMPNEHAFRGKHRIESGLAAVLE